MHKKLLTYSNLVSQQKICYLMSCRQHIKKQIYRRLKLPRCIVHVKGNTGNTGNIGNHLLLT